MGGLSFDIWSLLLGLGAGLACGFLNTAASSGSAVSLPILMMVGLDPVSANATNRIPVLIDLALIITAAVLVALVLLFTKLKQAIESATSDTVRYGTREFLMFMAIGVWLGFIVLDGATYMLLALTLVVGLPLIHANAIKSAALVPTTVIAMLVFAYKGNVDWPLGAIMGAGSIAGAVLGARLATSPQARKWVFLLLVVVISLELVHLAMHYVFKTH